MARARVNLKYFNHTVSLLARELEMARGKGTHPVVSQDIASLCKKVKQIQKMMAGECPDSMFRDFEVSER